MSDMTLVSDIWLVQNPESPPAARVGPYADETAAMSDGQVKLATDATWTAFGIERTWHLVPVT